MAMGPLSDDGGDRGVAGFLGLGARAVVDVKVATLMTRKGKKKEL